MKPGLGLHHSPELATLRIAHRNYDVYLAVDGDWARGGQYLVSVLLQDRKKDHFRIGLCASANQLSECTQFLTRSALLGRHPSDTGFQPFESLLRARLNDDQLIHPRRQLLQPNRKVTYPGSQGTE